MTRLFKVIVLIATLCLSAAGHGKGREMSVYKTVVIRGQRYEIPSEYFYPDLPSAMVPRGPGMDVDEGVNLAIPLVDLGITPLPHSAASGMSRQVSILFYGRASDTPMNEYGLNPAAYNAWTGAGHYARGRVIEKDEKTGLYRIYWRRGAKSWQYFRAPPSSDEGVSGRPKWVASCRIRLSEAEAEDMSNVLCRTDLSVDQGDAEIWFTGRYIAQIRDIKEGIRRKIIEWSKMEE